MRKIIAELAITFVVGALIGCALAWHDRTFVLRSSLDAPADSLRPENR